MVEGEGAPVRRPSLPPDDLLLVSACMDKSASLLFLMLPLGFPNEYDCYEEMGLAAKSGRGTP